METLLTTKEAAEKFGLQEGTLKRWRKNSQGPPYIQLGRTIRYDISDLNQWMEGHKRL